MSDLEQVAELCERLNEALIEAGRTMKAAKALSQQQYWQGVCRGYAEALLIVQDFIEDMGPAERGES